MSSISEIYDLVNSAIDTAVTYQKYHLDFYSYLKQENYRREEIQKFLDSSISLAIKHQIEELECYLEGGDRAAFFRESYGWMGKPRARKFSDYLKKIVCDAEKYEKSKRRGRKPGSKNRKKSTSTNK